MFVASSRGRGEVGLYSLSLTILLHCIVRGAVISWVVEESYFLLETWFVCYQAPRHGLRSVDVLIRPVRFYSSEVLLYAWGSD